MERLCACGCGGQVTSKRKTTKYIHGHNGSGISRVFSEETRKKMSESHMGKPGKPHTEETKRKLSEAHRGKPKTKEAIAKRTATRNAKGNYKHTEEQKQKIRDAWERGAYNSEETKRKHSEAIRKAWMDGKMVCNVPNNWSTPVKYKGIQMRSKLEASVAQRLDDDNIIWQYEPERFDLGEFTYLPDFYIPEYDLYIEAKGAEQGLEKVEAFRKTGKNVMVVKDNRFTLPEKPSV